MGGRHSSIEENKMRKASVTGRKRGKVDYEEFIRVWMKMYKQGGSRLDLCRELDITYETAASRKEKLQKNGVPLPPLLSGNTISKIQTAKLKELAEQLKEDEPTGPSSGMKKPPVV